jgi:hypothetical protein
VEQEPQPVVVEVAHAMSDPADLLGDKVLGLNRSGRDAGRVEVEHFLLTARDGRREASELCDVGFSDS